MQDLCFVYFYHHLALARFVYIYYDVGVKSSFIISMARAKANPEDRHEFKRT